MIHIKKETAFQLLLQAGYDDFCFHASKCKEEPMYGNNYTLTFNQQDAMVLNTLSAMEKCNLTKGKRVLECFSGNAYESSIIRDEYGENDYTGVDIDLSYFGDRIDGIKYMQEDCLDINCKEDDFDLVFVGETNSSLCMLYTEKELIAHFKYVHRKLKKGGVYFPSYYSHVTEFNKVELGCTASKIEFHPLQGNYVHWGCVLAFDCKDDSQTYTSHVIVSPDKFLHKDSEILLACVNPEPYITRSWDQRTVDFLLENEGFVKVFVHDACFCYIKL